MYIRPFVWGKIYTNELVHKYVLWKQRSHKSCHNTPSFSAVDQIWQRASATNEATTFNYMQVWLGLGHGLTYSV